MKNADWAPDFGLAEFVSSWGATVTGARSFLIAYNVNLLATKEQAHRIALNIREQGRPNQVGMGLINDLSHCLKASSHIIRPKYRTFRPEVTAGTASVQVHHRCMHCSAMLL